MVLLPTLRELGIALVAWSPLGSGFLTGTVTQLDAKDFRRNNPKYVGDNFAANLDRFAPFMKTANQCGITPAQLALAWLLHQGGNIFPIPGTRKPERIDENAKAASITLTNAVIEGISKLARPGLAEGATLV